MWDCRHQCCILSDFHAAPDTRLDLGYLESRLRYCPDQYLAAELRRFRSLGWYEFYSSLPLWPMYLNGQGAMARKLEPDRSRRTSEGNGPRPPTFDASGLQAISINEASHIYRMPQHCLRYERPEFRDWLRARGLPAPSPSPASATSRFTKWPEERKPHSRPSSCATPPSSTAPAT